MWNFAARIFAISALVFSFQAVAGSREVEYGKSPSWVIDSPAATIGSTSPNAAFRFVYYDTQVNLSNEGTEIYTAYWVKILKPEALALGNIVATWQPDAGGVRVHSLRIIRGGLTIDVLDQTKFKVTQREQNMEKSILDGRLTASLQVPGLQVGDEIEFAATVTQKDQTLGDHVFGLGVLPSTGFSGAFRIRLIWPKDKVLNWSASKDMVAPVVTTENGRSQIVLELNNPSTPILTDGAPVRFNIRRLLEYTDFQNWTDVSKRLAPLYERAATLAPASPLREEIKRIAARTRDPVLRTEAALQLVEDQIRYVYIGLDGGNLVPAPADETWQRRFGDCKAKTALLMALLKGLEIEAAPMMVNINGGDGMNERLPSPGLFNHVVVRALIAGKPVYLDGSRLGDRSLALLPQPTFRWGLPLRLQGAQLEAIPTLLSAIPESVTVVDIDATAGIGSQAKVQIRQILRGDKAIEVKAQLDAASSGDVEAFLKEYWNASDNWIEATSVQWRYGQDTGAVELSVIGTADLKWNDDWLDIPGAGFTPPAKYNRPKEQDQAAAWSIEYPAYRCWITTIRLPPPGDRWSWSYQSKTVNVEMGGIRYWRDAAMSKNVMRTTMSKRSLVPEISASEAAQVNKDVANFDNNISRVYKVSDDEQKSYAHNEFPLFADNTDWLNSFLPCEPPPLQAGSN